MSIIINQEMYTQIQVALINDNLDFIKDLIKQKYNINQVLFPRANKNSILIEAVSYAAHNCIKFLLDNGANANYEPYKDPLIFFATRVAANRGALNIVEILINNGVKLNGTDWRNLNILESLEYNLTNFKSGIINAPYYNQVVELIERHLKIAK